MPTRVLEYLRPEVWAEAIRLLGRRDRRTAPLAPGARPAPLSDLNAEAVVDLSRLNLAYIDDSQAPALRLGGLTPLQLLVESDAVASMAGGILIEAACLAGGLGLRNLATLAGTLASREGPPELRLALLALDASLTVQGANRREIALASWQPAEGEVVVEVRLDESAARARGSLQRVARTPRDQAIVSVVAVLDLGPGGECRQVRLAVAGASRSGWPERVAEAEALLAGGPLTPERIQQAAEAATAWADPQPDYRGSARYRRAMAGNLAGRALEAASAPAGS